MLVQMDGVGSASSASANEQLEESDNKKKVVMVLGATNRPWDIDEALRRRFEKRIYIPLPNKKGREECFKLNLTGVTTSDNVNFSKLVDATEGYSGADVANVCREAALMQMRRRVLNNKGGDIMSLINNPEFNEELNAPITMEDFEESLKNTSKSVSNVDLEKYVNWTKVFGNV